MTDDPQERRRGPEGWDVAKMAENLAGLDDPAAAAALDEARDRRDGKPGPQARTAETGMSTFLYLAFTAADRSLDMGEPVRDERRKVLEDGARSMGCTVVFTKTGFELIPGEDEASRLQQARTYVLLASQEGDKTLGLTDEHMRVFIDSAAAEQGYVVTFTNTSFTLELGKTS